MLELQQQLPSMEWPALVAGPVLLVFEWTGTPPHKARPRARIVIPSDCWSYTDRLKFISAEMTKKIWIHFYGENETAAHEKAIAEYAGLLMRRVRNEPTERPLAMLVHAFRPIPDSWSLVKKAQALARFVLPTSRPDGDNYLKLVQDALNGIVYKDDAQIVDSRVIKQYSDRPALRVEIREMIEPPRSQP